MTVRHNVCEKFSFTLVIVSIVTSDHNISPKYITFDCLRISLRRLCHRYRSVFCSSHVSSSRKVRSKGIAKSSNGTTLPQYHTAIELRHSYLPRSGQLACKADESAPLKALSYSCTEAVVSRVDDPNRPSPSMLGAKLRAVQSFQTFHSMSTPLSYIIAWVIQPGNSSSKSNRTATIARATTLSCSISGSWTRLKITFQLQ